MKYGYTIVQHSGFGYGRDTTFRRGLEVRELHTKAEHERALKAGGIIFNDRKDAIEYEQTEMYPESYHGFTPKAPGQFSDRKIDGLAIYIPGEHS